jgi:tetratricopeptide (TPR) repeat protein
VRFRGQLAEQFGVDPNTVLQHLHLSILRGEKLQEPQPAGGPITPAQLPADLPGFVGRARHLHQLDALLPDVEQRATSATAVVISAIGGTAGVGKTTLAVHWAHRVRYRFPDGQLYLNLRGFDPGGAVVTPAQAVRQFLDALQVPPQRIPAGLDAQLDLYRSLLADKQILIVLDNARDTAQVRPLLPGASGCLALITSRNQLTGLIATDGAHPIGLDLLSPAEARQLLAHRLGADRVAAESDAVEQIIAACARLPLALAVVAARAAVQPHCALAPLAGELADRRRLDALTGDDPHADLRAVFSWSNQALTPGAGRLFRLLGLHPGPDIASPAAASLAALTQPEVRLLLAELTGANLLTEHLPGRYTMHDLLRVYAAEQARATEPDVQARTAVHRMLDHYLHTAHAAAMLLDPHRQAVSLSAPRPGVQPETLADLADTLAWFRAEYPVLLAIVRSTVTSGPAESAWQLAWTLTGFLDRRAQWHDLATVQAIALKAAQRLSDRVGEMRARNALAIAYTRLRKYADAEAHLRSALDLCKDAGDLDGQAHMHHNIAWLLERTGHPEQALGHEHQGLELYRRIGNRQGEARTLNAIGWYHALVGNHSRTLTPCLEALALLETLNDRQAQAQTLDTLGLAYHHLGHHAQAINCYERAVALNRTLEDRFYEANTLSRLGDVHHAAGDLPAARHAWQQALTILNDLGHPNADDVQTKLNGVAAL